MSCPEGWSPEQSPIKDLKRGELVRLKHGSPQDRVWVRGDYDRTSKKYNLTAYDDINRERFVKGATQAWHGFTF